MAETRGRVLAVGFVIGLSAASPSWAAVELAKVNGRAITDKDLQLALGGLTPGQRLTLLKDRNSRKQVLLNVIDQEILAQEAEKEKLDQDQEYKDAVASFRKQYLATRLTQRNVAPKVTEAAAKKYFEAHKYKYSTDTARAQHILVTDENEARELMKKAKEPNADFQELAEKHSKDPSAKNNRGDLGVFGRDRFAPEFTEAVFNGEEGGIVGPVKTAFGYHVIKIVRRQIGKALEYYEVEAKVRNELQQQLLENYVGKLKETAKIAVDDKALEKL